MIELFKLDGTLKHIDKLLYDLNERRNEEAQEIWLSDMRTEYGLEDGFEEWLNETYIVTPETEDEFGNITPEVTALVREYTPIVVTMEELEAYLDTNRDYIKYLRNNMQVTTLSGKTFGADLLARVNISTAIKQGELNNITEKIWRLANGSEEIVTLDELKEAELLALQKFAEISGIGQ